MYEYLYGIGWPDIELLKMSRQEVKSHDAYIAAQMASESDPKKKSKSGKRGRSSSVMTTGSDVPKKALKA